MLSIRPITTVKVFDGLDLGEGANSSSPAIDLREVAQNGIFTLFYTLTGNGTCKFEFLLGQTVAGTFVTPSESDEIATGLTVGSDLISFSPLLAPFIKIKVTETGGADHVGVNAWLNMQ